MRRIVLALGLILFTGLIALTTLAKDGIPDNCEYNGQYQRENLFPRYEPHNARLVLVDWNTGADAMVLESGLSTDVFWILTWSPDCRYLVAKVGEPLDYYVWDTVNGGRVGVAADQPRRIHWSPDGTQALVERSSGAILWNLSNNAQFFLTDVYSPDAKRNFSHFRWNYDLNWLITTRVDGVRMVFNLDNGQPVEDFYTVLDANENSGITISDGAQYNCRYDRRSTYPYVTVEYEKAANRIVLVNNGVVQKVIEDNLDTPFVTSKRWSANCRYLAVSIGYRSASQTIVWDIVTGQRVDTIDAVGQRHLLSFDKTGEYAVIQTRNGGFLWHLPSNTRILLTDAKKASGSNFHRLEWYPERGWLVTVPVGAANSVVIYDMAGNQVGFYTADTSITPVQYQLYPEQNRIIVYNYKPNNYQYWNNGRQTGMAVYDMTTGAGIQLATGRYLERPSLSPDGRYVAAPLTTSTQDAAWTRLHVWDLSLAVSGEKLPLTYNFDITADKVPTSSTDITFHDATTLRISNRYYDVRTGARIDPQHTFNNPPLTAGGDNPADGHSALIDQDDIAGNCPYVNGEFRNPAITYVHTPYEPEKRWSRGDLSILNAETGATLMFFENVGSTRPRWSLDCRYMIFPWSYRYSALDITIMELVDLYDTTVNYAAISPDGDWVLASRVWTRFRSRDFAIINLNTGFEAPLDIPDYSQVSIIDAYWDFSRNLVFAAILQEQAVIAFDLSTGEQRYRFTTGDRLNWKQSADGAEVHLVMSQDGRFLFVQQLDTLNVWDLTTLQSHEVITGQAYYGPAQIAISPDGRFLVAVGWDIQVWDLSNLSYDVDTRTATFAYPGPDSYIDAMHFIDNTTIALTTRDKTTVNWDIGTGRQAP